MIGQYGCVSTSYAKIQIKDNIKVCIKKYLQKYLSNKSHQVMIFMITFQWE